MSRPDPNEQATATEALLAELFDLDVAHIADDIAFYESLAREAGGRALDIGCGTGRVALALARAGIDVTGIDSSAAMLDRARCKAGRSGHIDLVQADMRDFELGRQFSIAFAAFGTFHHLLTEADQLDCLRCVAAHLAPGGVFAFDMRPPWFADWEEGDSVPLLHDWSRALPRTGETVMKLRAVRADARHQIQHELHIYDRIASDGTVRRVTNEIDLRYSAPSEIDRMLRDVGLELDARHGAFDCAPLDDDSELMITIARKPEARSAA